MPSYIIHLCCAKQFLKYCENLSEKEENELYIGNVAADMVEDKKYSHFWDDQTYQCLERRPNLQMFLEQYGDRLYEPYVYGYYMHLCLDAAFLEQYWDKHFRFYNKDGKPEAGYGEVRYVEVLEQGCMYEREQFFSRELYYGDYDRMNPYFARKYQILIPDIEALTGCLNKYTAVREIDWNSTLPIMNRTFDFLRHSTREDFETLSELTNPPLNIFLLPELETIVDSVAKEMARRYA